MLQVRALHAPHTLMAAMSKRSRDLVRRAGGSPSAASPDSSPAPAPVQPRRQPALMLPQASARGQRIINVARAPLDAQSMTRKRDPMCFCNVCNGKRVSPTTRRNHRGRPRVNANNASRPAASSQPPAAKRLRAAQPHVEQDLAAHDADDDEVDVADNDVALVSRVEVLGLSEDLGRHTLSGDIKATCAWHCVNRCADCR